MDTSCCCLFSSHEAKVATNSSLLILPSLLVSCKGTGGGKYEAGGGRESGAGAQGAYQAVKQLFGDALGFVVQLFVQQTQAAVNLVFVLLICAHPPPRPT